MAFPLFEQSVHFARTEARAALSGTLKLLSPKPVCSIVLRVSHIHRRHLPILFCLLQNKTEKKKMRDMLTQAGICMRFKHGQNPTRDILNLFLYLWVKASRCGEVMVVGG